MSYDLAGIKDRIKTRISHITESYQAHSDEAKRIVADVKLSQTIIEEKVLQANTIRDLRTSLLQFLHVSQPKKKT